MEDLIPDYGSRDLLEIDEISDDDKCLHQIPNQGQTYHDAFGGMYFSHVDMQAAVKR